MNIGGACEIKVVLDKGNGATGLWQVLRNYGIPEELLELLEVMYGKSLSAVRVDERFTEWFRVTVGVRQ